MRCSWHSALKRSLFSSTKTLCGTCEGRCATTDQPGAPPRSSNLNCFNKALRDPAARIKRNLYEVKERNDTVCFQSDRHRRQSCIHGFVHQSFLAYFYKGGEGQLTEVPANTDRLSLIPVDALVVMQLSPMKTVNTSFVTSVALMVRLSTGNNLKS